LIGKPGNTLFFEGNNTVKHNAVINICRWKLMRKEDMIQKFRT
jgi:hypothetical protein